MSGVITITLLELAYYHTFGTGYLTITLLEPKNNLTKLSLSSEYGGY